MFAKLKAKTVSLNEDGSVIDEDYTGDLLVVNAARVSFDKSSLKLSEPDKKLMKFLADHKHTLPYRHPHVTLHCKAPIFVMRQVGKHEVGFQMQPILGSWSEISRRYIDSEPEFFMPDEWRERPKDGIKQGSGGVHDNQELARFLSYWVNDTVREAYNEMLASGVAPEQARMVLPQSMYSEWIWTGSLLAWAFMYSQRTEQHAQKETRDFAELCGEQVEKVHPNSWPLLVEMMTNG